VSWPWLVLLVLAVAVVIGAEWPRIGALVGADARRERERSRRKATFKVIRSEEEEFAASVERDLADLPTIEERDRT
jgi:hypothetical protein